MYVFFQIINHALPVLVPDERTFLEQSLVLLGQIHQNGVAHVLFNYPNVLGFGSIYWLIQGLFVGIFRVVFNLDYSLCWIPLRILSFTFFIGLPVFVSYKLWKKVSSKSAKKFMLFLFLMPFSWWTGKIIGCEVYIVGLTYLAGYFYITARFGFSFLIVGMCVGLKLSALPVMGFFGILSILEHRSVKEHFKHGSLLMLGFVIANPFLLSSPELFILETDSPSFRLTHLKRIVLGDVWAWDAVFAGGIFFWSWGVLGWLAMTFFFFHFLKRSWFYAWVSASLGSIVMFLSNARFYGWYAFPMLALTPLAAMSVVNDVALSKRWKWLSVSLLIFATIPGVKIVTQCAELKWALWTNLKHQEQIKTEILAEISKLGLAVPSLVVDFSEVPTVFSLEEKDFPSSRYYQTYRAFLWLSHPAEISDDTQKDNVLVIIGDRVGDLHRDKLPFFQILKEQNKLDKPTAVVGHFKLWYLPKKQLLKTENK